MQLKILSAGAAQGIVTALGERFRDETECEIDDFFSGVGRIKAKLLAGAPVDLIILTASLIAELVADGQVRADTCVALGTVRTGLAVRCGDPLPDISSVAGLRACFRAAQGVYIPDPRYGTAGGHLARVLDALDIRRELDPRLRAHADGPTAMRELARAAGERLIGVTQITEIINTPGVTVVGPLPGEFDLATVYSAGVCTRANAPDLAYRFAALLGGDSSRALRAKAGFEL